MVYRYIYKITCTAGSFKDKFYYGQHTTENLNDGYKGSGRKINDYYKKYPNDYIKEIIAFYNTDEELNKAEYDIIKPYLNNNMCLNLKDGGGNCGRLSSETIKKMSQSLKGKFEGSKNPNYGKKCSEETRKKISESCKGKCKGIKRTEETRKKISESRKGKQCSEETKKKLRLVNLGKHHSEETKKKLSQSHKGKHYHSEDYKKKLSESLKGEKNPMYGKHHSDGCKQILSNKLKGRISPIKGKHKVFDNKELNIYHYE